MALKNVQRKILIILYSLSLLFFGYQLIVQSTIKISNENNGKNGAEALYAAVGYLFYTQGLAMILGILWIIVLFQSAFFLMLILKKEWLKEHISFKILSWSILLIPAVAYGFFLFVFHI